MDSIYEELLTEDEKIIIDELYFHKYQAVHALRKVKKFTSEEFNNVLLSFNSRSLSMAEYDRIPTTDIGKVIYQELYQD
ncbi:MAG: hypothetical protein QG561_1040 [Patescibacteria group bacterium]|nr:hypothetical protein [Patescibacteria group bacterium]